MCGDFTPVSTAAHLPHRLLEHTDAADSSGCVDTRVVCLRPRKAELLLHPHNDKGRSQCPVTVNTDNSQ